MLDSQAEVQSMQRRIKQVCVEKSKGKYEYYSSNGPELTGLDLTDVEGINAMIMYRLTKEIPDGKDKVFASFKNTNYPWRSLRDFLKDVVKNNPDKATAIGKILNEETYGKLSDSQMMEFLGSSAGVKTFLAGGRGKEPIPVPTTGQNTSGTNKAVKVLSTGANPFSQ